MAYSKHGMTHTKLYEVFKGMKTRCRKSDKNPRNKHYKDKNITSEAAKPRPSRAGLRRR